MKKVFFSFVLLCFIIISGCTSNQEVQELSHLRPMVRVNDHLFLDTGKEISINLQDLEIAGEIISSTPQHEKPSENNQTNFGFIGSKFAYYGDDIVIFMKDKWILFDRAE